MPQGRWLKVMVVEDDGPTRAMYQSHFDHWDMPLDAVMAASAIEALLDIPLVKPHVLITDLRMPGIDGAAMLRQLSQHPLFAKLGVIVVTGLSLKDIQAYGPLPEGTQVVQKPVDMGWLKGYFQALLSLRSPTPKRPTVATANDPA
jgi:CheY-like chemotaxis protein